MAISSSRYIAWPNGQVYKLNITKNGDVDGGGGGGEVYDDDGDNGEDNDEVWGLYGGEN